MTPTSDEKGLNPYHLDALTPPEYWFQINLNHCSAEIFKGIRKVGQKPTRNVLLFCWRHHHFVTCHFGREEKWSLALIYQNERTETFFCVFFFPWLLLKWSSHPEIDQILPKNCSCALAWIIFMSEFDLVLIYFI